jgi:drug/metabolite transporter (DMT)-like permease
MGRSAATVWSCLVGAMVLVGSTVVASKLMASGATALQATLLRFLVATPVMLAIAFGSSARLPRLPWRDWLLLVIQAAAGSVGYTILLVLGLARTSAGDAAVITGTLPAVTALVAVLLLRERPGLRLLLAIGCATLGVLMLHLPAAGGSVGTQRVLGNLLVFGAVLGESLFALLNKRLTVPVPPTFVATAMSALALLLVLPAALIEQMLIRPPLPSASAAAAAVYYGLVATVLGFLLWYHGAARASGTQAAVATAAMPVAALLLSWLVLGEVPLTAQFIGLILVVGAITLVARSGIGEEVGAPNSASPELLDRSDRQRP